MGLRIGRECISVRGPAFQPGPAVWKCGCGHDWPPTPGNEPLQTTGAVVNAPELKYRAADRRQKFGCTANYRKKHILGAPKTRLGRQPHYSLCVLINPNAVER
jgi:hypothetical protein